MLLALTGAYVIGLAALTNRTNAASSQAAAAAAVARQDARDRGRLAKLRAHQLQAAHRQDVRSCQSRHQLDVAIKLVASSLLQAESQAIAQAEQIERAGGTLPGETRAQSERSFNLARTLVANLKRAHTLAIRADCHSVPSLPGSKTSPKR